ncbi:hypothetical protein PybrP1_007824 [[Pythium] brassicae (nom. inval.)]|nr:hypothetical protein PybrP1_007824 [[Pythium] brassicae (nom. inval.)]
MQRQEAAPSETLLPARRSSSSGGGGDASARPRSGAASSAARPVSSSTLLASVANARFKSFQVQYEVLSTSPVLGTIAAEIPWKNLLELFQLKFVAVGDVLWQQGGPAHELAFVLCGGFLARRMAFEGGGASIRAEKVVKPGGSLAALAVHCSAPVEYAVVAAKFKSIVVALPAGKYKSILRQLSPACRAALEALLYDAENKLRLALQLPPVAPPRESSRAQRSHRRHGDVASPGKRLHPQHPHFSNSSATTTTRLQRAASMPTATASAVGAAAAVAAALVRPDATASWASLQTTTPVEFEVNSSLLILHDAPHSTRCSTGSMHHLAPAARAGDRKRGRGGGGGALRASAAARLAATKHAQRRLQSIKLPNAFEAFPPPSRRLVGDAPSDADLLRIAEMALEDTAVKRAGLLDVVPKLHIGRLLKPLRQLATLQLDEPSGGQRPHTVAGALDARQRVLVADRAEPFRGAGSREHTG